MSTTENMAEKYRNFIINENRRTLSKEFNNRLTKFKYILIYPFNDTEGLPSALVGFSNENVVLEFGEHTKQEAMKLVDPHFDMLRLIGEPSFSKTLVFETSDISKIEVPVIPWNALIDAPKLQDSSFEILSSSFLEFFNLEESEYNFETNENGFDWNQYFYGSNKPDDLELRVVWLDVDRYDKYGNIVTNVFWKNEFIGWIYSGGRYMDRHSASTVNFDKWSEMMNYIKDNSGYVPLPKALGVNVVDMNSTQPDDFTFVPTVSEYIYKD